MLFKENRYAGTEERNCVRLVQILKQTTIQRRHECRSAESTIDLHQVFSVVLCLQV